MNQQDHGDDLCAPLHGSPPFPLGGVWITQGSPTLSSVPHAKKGRLALLCSVGGTIVSVVGFIALALFEQYNGMLSELRSDLKHFNEVSSEFVKRDAFQRSRDQIKERFKELQDASMAKALLETELKVSEKARDELFRELQKVRERIAYLEGQQTATSTTSSRFR